MAKGKGNKKSERNSGKVLKGIVAGVLLFVLLAAILLAAIAYFGGSKSSGGDPAFGGSEGVGGNAAFALAHNGKKYDKDARGVELLSGDEINVYLTEDIKSYKVEVTAYMSEENDIQFTIGNEPFKWSETSNKNFTSGFTFTQTKGGFKVEYKSISDIISAAYSGREVTIDKVAASGIELFTLTVSYGEGSISLTFAVGAPVEGIEISGEDIIS